MFSNLADSLDKTFRNLRGVGKISESNITDALRDVRLALLEALAVTGFQRFAARMREVIDSEPEDVMAAMGKTYVVFALQNPNLFRLMFSPQLKKDARPGLRMAADAAFETLREAVGGEDAAARTRTLAAWAKVHGLAVLLLDGQIAIRAGEDTETLIARILGRFGVHWLDFPAGATRQEIDAVLGRAASGNVALIYLESPANPNMQLVDIAAVAQAVRGRDIHVVVDNTYCTPYLQRPLELGADLVVHSATKYLSGHGDITAGLVVGRKALIDRIRLEGLKDMTGAVLSPHDASLLMRGKSEPETSWNESSGCEETSRRETSGSGADGSSVRFSAVG